MIGGFFQPWLMGKFRWVRKSPLQRKSDPKIWWKKRSVDLVSWLFWSFFGHQEGPESKSAAKNLTSEVKMFLFNTKNWGWENSHTWIR